MFFIPMYRDGRRSRANADANCGVGLLLETRKGGEPFIRIFQLEISRKVGKVAGKTTGKSVMQNAPIYIKCHVLKVSIALKCDW